VTVLDDLRPLGIVPVAVIDEPDHAVPLAEALLRGGLPCVEVTFRTPAASAVIERIASALPEVVVGAGTVLTVAQAGAARDAGARFVMSPGSDEAVVDWCIQEGMPVAPGVVTATEVNWATKRGLRVLKFFPAQSSGGVATLRALGGVHPDVGFIPTGGIDAGNLADYIEVASVVACGGSWLVPRDAIRAGDFGEVERRVTRAMEIVRSVRTTGSG
jgi:2-dehydro-3-deoxyphosphogluconate aldolase/(4S)-4-hydroxy-2-oxoglutarate aldolase